MKAFLCAMMTLLFCLEARANSNFIGNPYSPYPLGCAETPWTDIPAWLASRTIRFYSDEIELYDAKGHTETPIGVALYRSRCSEPNRSMIWIEFSLPNTPDNRNVEILVPGVCIEHAENYCVPLLLSPEPGGWQSRSEWHTGSAQSYLVMKAQGLYPRGDEIDASEPETRHWLFVLENIGPFGIWGKYFPTITADEYNDSFKLRIQSKWSIDVPATSTLLSEPEPGIPLSGRLSGIWVIDGAADQGIALAISEFVPLAETDQISRENPELVIFLAHYTFNGQGDLLWLTGNALFRPGVSEIDFPVESISGGEFRGGKAADRVNMGQVTLKANSCNDLELEYDYSTLELGSGTVSLHRPFSLETAGYECRDFAARVSANH